MKDKNQYAELGLRALKRAAIKVAEKARRNNLKIPIWEDGQVKYIDPEIQTDQIDSKEQPVR